MRTFFSKKSFSFSEIAPLVLETIAQILSRNSATQHFSQKKSDQNLAEKKPKSDQNWSNLIKSDQIWSKPLFWSDLIRFDQIWSDLISFDQFFLFGFFEFIQDFFGEILVLQLYFPKKNPWKKETSEVARS